MNALPESRFKGATAFDVAVISNVLCRLLSHPKHTKHHKVLKEMAADMAVTCDGIMEVVGSTPETLDPVTRMIVEEMPLVGMEIFEDFAERLRNKDPVLMALVKQFPLTP